MTSAEPIKTQQKRWSPTTSCTLGHRHVPLEMRADRAETLRTPEQQFNRASKPTRDAKLPGHFLAFLPVLLWIWQVRAKSRTMLSRWTNDLPFRPPILVGVLML